MNKQTIFDTKPETGITEGAFVDWSVRNTANIIPTKLASILWYIYCVARSEIIEQFNTCSLWMFDHDKV